MKKKTIKKINNNISRMKIDLKITNLHYKLMEEGLWNYLFTGINSLLDFIVSIFMFPFIFYGKHLVKKHNKKIKDEITKLELMKEK